MNSERVITHIKREPGKYVNLHSVGQLKNKYGAWGKLKISQKSINYREMIHHVKDRI